MGNGAFAALRGDGDRRAQGRQSHGDIGRMHDEATIATGHAQVFAHTLHRIAPVAAALQAYGEGMAVVPAAGPLVEVAAQGAEVAHLRGRQACGRLGQGGVAAADAGVGGDVGDGGQRADAEAAIGRVGDPDKVGVSDGVQGDEGGRLCSTVSYLREEVGTAGHWYGIVGRGGQQGAGFDQGSGLEELEGHGVHRIDTEYVTVTRS